MKAKDSTHPQYKGDPITTYEALVGLRALYAEALAGATEADRNYLNGAIATLDEAMKSLNTKSAETKKAAAISLREIDTLTDRGRVMARLARKIGRGCDAIYHGTRHLPLVLRCGKLVPPLSGERALFLSRSPEAAAYFASLPGIEADQYSPGVLVLNRRSLTQSYRLEPSRYDQESEQDEREEVIWDRIVNFRRHLLGVVGESDVTAILGPPKHKCLPPAYRSWPQKQRSAFHREQREAADKLVRDGRARVREIIIMERTQRSMANARLPTAPIAVPTRRTIKLSKKTPRRRTPK
jgi:hypothetical protein